MFVESEILWLCMECHDQVNQNHLRPLYGLTGATVSSVLGELDRVDPHRDLLAGADLRVRNQLDADLQRLEANIVATTRKFNECRDETLEAFFGTDDYCHIGLDRAADQGQRYCFIPHDQPVAASMLTPWERREKELPVYERDLVPNPYPALPTSNNGNADDDLPDYSDVCPYNSLDEFEPLDEDCNDDAVSEGASSASSDCFGEGMTRIEIMGRLRRKLRDEFWELNEMDEPSTADATSTRETQNRSILFSPAQQARFGTLQLGSLDKRRIRRQQLRKQLQTLNILLSEELQIVSSYKELVLLRTAVMNGEASKTSRLAETRQTLQRAVQEILQNRVNHSLSELLLPLNGTNPSKCHAVHLLPESHRNMFAARAFGFPRSMAKDQFESYTATPGYKWSDGGDEDPEDNDDLDDNGNIKLAPSATASLATDMDNLMSDASSNTGSKDNAQQDLEIQRKDYVPVTQLKRYHVEEDEHTPKVRIVRIPRQGLVFELVMPRDAPRHLKPNAPSESAPLQAIPNERLSLLSLVEAVRVHMGAANMADVDNLPAIIASSTPPAQVRLTLDMTSVDRDAELSRILSEARARPPATATELTSMPTLEEVVHLALQIDGRVSRPSLPAMWRLRELVTGGLYVPPRLRSPEPSPPGVVTDVYRLLQAMRDDPLRDARSRSIERDHDRQRRADEQEEVRPLLQSMNADGDEEQHFSDGAAEIDYEDDISEDELDGPWLRRR